MTVPFTERQFFDVFVRYNEAVWPSQIALLLIAVVTAVAGWRASRLDSWRHGQAAFALLAVLWLFTGVVYFKMFFSAITGAGEIFGSLFIAQAGLLLICIWQNERIFQPAPRVARAVGAVLIGYALVLYPLIGNLAGHRYPAAPSFGAPCPLTIFTLGMFCLLPASTPRFALVIPILWAVIGSSAALEFGVVQDLGLLVAAVVVVLVIHRATHRTVLPRGAH